MDLVSVQYLRLRALILTTGLLSSSAIILVLPVESDLREGEVIAATESIRTSVC